METASTGQADSESGHGYIIVKECCGRQKEGNRARRILTFVQPISCKIHPVSLYCKICAPVKEAV